MGIDNDSSVAVVRKYLGTLRRKLCHQDESAYIRTVHGVGTGSSRL